MRKKKKYDFIFSIGEACACTQALRKSDLQMGSLPLDWLYGGNFDLRINLLLNNFNHFIEKDDLVFLNKNNGDSNNLCDVYQNSKNSLIFNHDFKSNTDFNEAYEEVTNRYNRRIKRLYDNIERAQSILLVYQEIPIAANEHPNDSTLLEAIDRIKAKYPKKKIDLLYFESDLSLKSKTYKEYRISENITKVVANYKEIKVNAPQNAVLFTFFKKYYKNFSLNMPFTNRLKIVLLRFFVRHIPIRTLRYNLREKYHITY